MSGKTGVMLCGHGSRDIGGIEEFGALAQKLRAQLPQFELEWGFLEFATPIIREGLDKLVARGCREILAVPGMLLAAGHVKNDVPSVLNRYQAERPGISIRMGRDLGVDPKLIQAAAASIETARAKAARRVPLHDTMLVVVGRGTSDPDANSDIAKIMRLLLEGFGFGWGETAYSGVTFPLVEPALERAARLGFKRIIVFPYFLFSGVLVSRIYEHMDIVAERHPQIEFIKASYLNDHPLVLEAFRDRIEEILDGKGNMNCQLCKYRVQMLGFENEIGLVQESHHHHVEGIGTGAASPGHLRHHYHDHPHDHAHDAGHHHPYPNADHPLGPATLRKIVGNK